MVDPRHDEPKLMDTFWETEVVIIFLFMRREWEWFNFMDVARCQFLVVKV